jgi:integrase
VSRFIVVSRNRGNTGRVKLRRRENKDSITLYFDTFVRYDINPDGKKVAIRKRQDIGRLIKKPKTPIEKKYNKNLLDKARLIQLNKEQSFVTDKFSLQNSKKENSLVKAFIVNEIERVKGESTKGSIKNMLSHFTKHFPKNITFKEINKREVARGFYEFLTDKALKKNEENLSTNTANKYFKTLRLLLKKALLEEYIKELRFDVKLLPETLPEVVFLTFEEYRTLEKTEESNTTMKNAFLFACLTALRIGDLYKLTWGDIKEDGDKIYYNFIMDKKPNGKERRISNPFTPYAKKYLGERQGDSDKVFPDLPKGATSKLNQRMGRWMTRAGISKHITFHCAKHSFAMYHIIYKKVGVFELAGLLNNTNIRSSMHYYDLCSPELKERLLVG